MKPKNTICLWFEKDALEAARFYAATFPDSAVGATLRAPGDHPSGKQGALLTVEFTVCGIPCVGLNGGPAFKHSEAFSFQIATENQEETDRYWNAIVGNGGMESQCGWCKDRWGISWQMTPRVLLAEHRERERGVYRVAEWVEDRRDLVRHPRPVVPDVRHREGDELRERARPLHAEANRVRAEVPPSRHAVPAPAADDVPLSADPVAGLEPRDVRPHRDHVPDELVADHERDGDRPLRPGVPAVDVDVGAADARYRDADQDVVDSDLGLGHVLEPEAGLGAALDERLHYAAKYSCAARGP